MSMRVWILSIDESVEQTKHILEFEARKEKLSSSASIEKKLLERL